MPEKTAVSHSASSNVPAVELDATVYGRGVRAADLSGDKPDEDVYLLEQTPASVSFSLRV